MDAVALYGTSATPDRASSTARSSCIWGSSGGWRSGLAPSVPLVFQHGVPGEPRYDLGTGES